MTIKGTTDFNDRLIFEYCSIQEPVINDNTLTVNIHNLIVDGKKHSNCIITFYKVNESLRKIYEYIGNPASKEDFLGFKPEQLVLDITSPEISNAINSYNLEGVYEAKEGWRGWLDWYVKADSYEVIIKNDE